MKAAETRATGSLQDRSGARWKPSPSLPECGKIPEMPYWLDGNNLIGQTVAQARKDPGTRRAFLAEIAGFARSRGGRFVIYFDGDDPAGTRAPCGIQVRYSAPRSTDDDILRRLEEVKAPSEIWVVTNDRSLANRCRNSGAKILNWQSFLSKMKPKARPGSPSPDAKEEKVNVEEWIRYFGYDKRTLR